jgi:hypothetical protein
MEKKESKTENQLEKRNETGSWIYRDHLVGYLYIYAAWLDSCSESFDNN